MSKSMLFGCSLLFLFAILVNNCDSYPYQLLPNRDGYIPVYIRMGDTPLNDINPALAVAFHEVAVNGRQLKSNDEFMTIPQEMKLAPLPIQQIEPKVEKKEIKTEEHEPQPVEHQV